MAACADTPAPPTRRATATRAVEVEAGPVATATPDEAAAIEEASVGLGEIMGGMYQAARKQLGKEGGAARYWGDNLDRIEISAAFVAEAKDFGEKEYDLVCEGPAVSPLCHTVRVFPKQEVNAAAQWLRRLRPDAVTELNVAGRADRAWKPKQLRHYQGECGEAECKLEEGALALRSGMAVDSSATLACLRALCMLHQSGLKEAEVVPRLRGVLTRRDASAESRRAEIGIFMSLRPEHRRVIWDAFLRKVGHR